MPGTGPAIDRVDHAPRNGNLTVMAVSCAGIQLFEGVWMTGVLLLGLGLG